MMHLLVCACLVLNSAIIHVNMTVYFIEVTLISLVAVEGVGRSYWITESPLLVLLTQWV